MDPPARIFYGHVCPIYQRDSSGMREAYTRRSVSDPLSWHFRRNAGLAGGCSAANANMSLTVYAERTDETTNEPPGLLILARGLIARSGCRRAYACEDSLELFTSEQKPPPEGDGGAEC